MVMGKNHHEKQHKILVPFMDVNGPYREGTQAQ